MAAHGIFRGDNPLFSTLDLADGPMTVYDLDGLRRPPHRLVLSACESGAAAPTGADELLGLASSLVELGTAGLVASVARATAWSFLALGATRLLRAGSRSRLDRLGRAPRSNRWEVAARTGGKLRATAGAAPSRDGGTWSGPSGVEVAANSGGRLRATGDGPRLVAQRGVTMNCDIAVQQRTG